MKTKNVTVQMKADAEALSEGQFTGYAAVFDNKDSYGDVIRKGAFTESLKAYGESGAGIPCYWSHQMSNPMMCIGETVEAKEDERGLRVKVKLDTDTEMGAQVHRLIKLGRVNQMSFAFDVEDYAFAESDELGDYMELRKLKVHEVSVVQVGANQETELLDVKDRLTRLSVSGSEDRLKEAASLIKGVLESLDANEDFQADEPGEDSNDELEAPPEAEPPTEGVKTGGHPDIALANINMIALKGAL